MCCIVSDPTSLLGQINWELLLATATAVWGVNQWKRELIGRKQAELAERALTLSSRIEQVISHSRNPAVWSGEGLTRPLGETETPEKRNHQKDSLYAHIERLEVERELFSQFHELWHVFRAYYGRDKVDDLFKPFFKIRGDIQRAAWSLIRDAEKSSLPGNIRDRHHNTIWEGYSCKDDESEDSIQIKIQDTIKDIESFCSHQIRPKVGSVKKVLTKLSCFSGSRSNG